MEPRQGHSGCGGRGRSRRDRPDALLQSCRRARSRWRCPHRALRPPVRARAARPRNAGAINENARSTTSCIDLEEVRPGSGSPAPHHHVVLENYASRAGCDRRRLHTPTRRLGMAAIGVGGADCGEAMAGSGLGSPRSEADRRAPHGNVAGWTPQGRHHLLCGLLTVKGAPTDHRYFGQGSVHQRHGRAPSAIWRGAGGHHPALPLDDRMAPTCAPPIAPTSRGWPSSTASTGRGPGRDS